MALHFFSTIIRECHTNIQENERKQDVIFVIQIFGPHSSREKKERSITLMDEGKAFLFPFYFQRIYLRILNDNFILSVLLKCNTFFNTLFIIIFLIIFLEFLFYNLKFIYYYIKFINKRKNYFLKSLQLSNEDRYVSIHYGS